MIPELLPTRQSAASEPYWAAAREGRLVVQRCANCSALQHPPGQVCVRCLSKDVAPETMSGFGHVYGFTVVERAMLLELRPFVPYVVALVDLDEGVRMLSNIIADPAAITIGARLRVAFRRIDGLAQPVFELA